MMDKLTVLISLLLLWSAAKAQPSRDTLIICEFPEAPQFPGGNDSLKSYLRRNFRWPEPGWDGEGTVYVKFKVDCKGKISEAKVLRGIDSLANKEALRLVNEMPDWTKVNCKGFPPLWYNLPIKFRME